MSQNIADFEASSLPWVDKPNFDLELGNRILQGKVTQGQIAQLREWRANGVLVYRKLIPDYLIDGLLEHYEKVWRERPMCRVQLYGAPRYMCDVPQRLDAGMSARVLDLHNISAAGKAIMLYPDLIQFMQLILEDVPVGMQSLFFEYGSEQPLHQDFVYVTSRILSHLVGVWIALEDIGPEQGPLLYLPGSHNVRKFDFGNGKLAFDESNRHMAEAWQKHLNEEVQNLRADPVPFHAQKGDVVFWHSALVHGGSPILCRNRTRKSFVIHYSSRTSYRSDYRNKLLEPEVVAQNGGVTYRWVHPEHVEDRYQL